jgi:steroid 5-alpha reductase family enzyme
VTHAILVRLLEAWAIAASGQLLLWLVQQRTRNAGIVDVGWSLSFAVFAAFFAVRSASPVSAWLPALLLVVAWSARLGGYLLIRGAATHPEEGRYKDLRARWGGDHAGPRIFVFFQAQALMAALLASAFVVPFLTVPSCDALRYIGGAIVVCAIAGEATSDWQLSRFKRTHKGAVCDVGLWSWSRHPNYFFEWCVWLGYAIHGLAFAPWGLIAFVPQALLLCSILFVTGIPPTEKQSLRSRGDLYRAYQACVSKFIPWPPKRF